MPNHWYHVETPRTPVDRPMLYSGPMVRAILDDLKNQTRRIIKPQPTLDQGWEEEPGWAWFWKDKENGTTDLESVCPYGKPGDHIWVRETYHLPKDCDNYKPSEVSECVDIWYAARGRRNATGGLDWGGVKGKGRPSIHMPRWASRINLEITGIRIERLQDISEDDAINEGAQQYSSSTALVHNFDPSRKGSYREGFRELWDTINGEKAWAENPLVWVVDFKKLDIDTKPSTQ